MLCAINIGNTHIALGLKKDGMLISTERYETKDFIEYDLVKQKLTFFFDNTEQIEDIVIASVVPKINETISKAIENIVNKKPIFLNESLFQNLKFDFSTYGQNEIGLDRLVVCYFVSKNYELPAVVIDFGTATTVNIIGERGEFLGGIIIPGISLWLAALCENTALLPDDISLVNLKSCVGRNTRECISVGIFYGISILIDGLIYQIGYETGYDIKTVIATGGGAEFVLPYCKSKIEYEKELLIRGLFYTYEQTLKKN